MEHPKTQFILKGFSQELGSRVFEFEGVEADRSRTVFTVTADLALTRRYGIQLQDLPLLCRAVLERNHEGSEKRAFAYTEADMRVHADHAIARAEAAKQRKPPRRPFSQRPHADDWRVPPV